MSATALTAFSPFMFSGMIFTPRRFGKGLGSDNALVSIMDYDIAIGQGAKVVESAANIAKESSNTSLAAKVIAKEKALEEFLKADKVFETLGKATRFTMNNINPLIGATETIKVLYADNKEEAALTGGLAFGGMLTGEAAAKNFLGLSKSEYKNGEYKITPRKALYKELPFYTEQREKAMKDFCATKTFMGKHIFKHAPKAAKGVVFAAASIGSYTLGNKVGQTIYDNISKKNDNKALTIDMNAQNCTTKSENTECKTNTQAA